MTREPLAAGHFPKLPKPSDSRRCSLRPRVARPGVNPGPLAEVGKSVLQRGWTAESAAAAGWAVTRNVSFSLSAADRLGVSAWSDRSLWTKACDGCDVSEDVRKPPT